MYFLVRSYHGQTYKAMPFALEQRTYREALREWHTQYGEGPAEGDREWVEYLERLYAEAADHNAGMNLLKSEYLFRANGAIIRCAIFAVLAFVPFAAHRALSPAAPQRIEIVNQPKLVLEEDKTVPQTAKPAPPPPPKPAAPPLRDLREGQIPKKK
jgi:hypothetical protein